jgi:hypothetical protein
MWYLYYAHSQQTCKNQPTPHDLKIQKCNKNAEEETLIDTARSSQ